MKRKHISTTNLPSGLPIRGTIIGYLLAQDLQDKLPHDFYIAFMVLLGIFLMILWIACIVDIVSHEPVNIIDEVYHKEKSDGRR